MKNNSLIYWLYGSGAAEHITNNINILSNFKQEKITLYCANGTLYEIEGYGECCLKINNHHIKLTKDKGIICTNGKNEYIKQYKINTKQYQSYYIIIQKTGYTKNY